MTKDEAIAKVLETALNGLQKTGEFVVEQAPDLVRQLILYKTATYAVALLFGLILLSITLVSIRKLLKARKAYIASRGGYADAFAYEFPAALIGFVGGGSGLALISTNTFNLIKITLAPKVWLLEYAAALVRGAT